MQRPRSIFHLLVLMLLAPLDGALSQCGTVLYQFTAPAGDDFGRQRHALSAADVDGDGIQDIIVGAMQYNNSSGGATGYVDAYSGATGMLLWRTTGASISSQLDWFGSSVDNAGDVNGDGRDDVIVGAPYTNNQAGAAIILDGATGTALRLHFGINSFDVLGYSATGLGDLNNDGRSEYAVGVPQFEIFVPAHVGPGYVTIHDGATGAPICTVTGLAFADRFGVSVADAGDLTGNGRSELIIGAPGHHQPGYARIYTWTGAGCTLVAHLANSDAQDLFGTDVDGAGDFDQDGHLDVAVGASEDHCAGPGTYSGNIQVLNPANPTSPVVFQCGEGAGVGLGNVLRGAGDVNADGYPDLLGGDDTSNAFQGCRVYLGPSGSLLCRLTEPGGRLGWSMTGVGDVDHDGFDEIAVNGENGSFEFVRVYKLCPSPLCTVNLTIDLDPDSMKLTSRGRWVTCYVFPPTGQPLSVLDGATPQVNTVNGLPLPMPLAAAWTSLQSDALMAKFDREVFATLLVPGSNLIEVTGTLMTGSPFSGLDTVVGIP